MAADAAAASAYAIRLGTPNVALGLPTYVQFLNTPLIQTRPGRTISATWTHNLRRVWLDPKTDKQFRQLTLTASGAGVGRAANTTKKTSDFCGVDGT
jgi:hypothetical protein